MSSFKDLIVWNKAYELTLLVYSLTKSFPKDEQYNFVSQIRRSALSIPSNIAEGHSRKGRKEFLHFLYVAYGSGAELETQLLLANDLGYIKENDFTVAFQLLGEVMKILNALLTKMSKA